MSATHVISLGAGVQSTVVYLMATHGLITPKPVAAIFADTGWEPPDVYEHLDWLEQQSDIPVHRVSEGNLYDDVMSMSVPHRGQSFPYSDIPTFYYSTRPATMGKAQMGKRQCTQQYKLKPIQREVRKILLGENAAPKARVPKTITACQWIGISTDEWYRAKDARVQYIANRWPLIEQDMSRTDCIRWFAENYPGRPLVKSSCVGCPYHSDRQWLDLARRHPDAMEKTYLLDEHLRAPERTSLKDDPIIEYLHRSKRPLREVIAKLDEQDRMQPRLIAEQDGIGNECEGVCWT